MVGGLGRCRYIAELHGLRIEPTKLPRRVERPCILAVYRAVGHVNGNFARGVCACRRIETMVGSFAP